MERPRLRNVEAFPAKGEDGRPMICLRDPTGLTDRIAALQPAAVAVVSLFDGVRTVADIQAEILRRAGRLVGREQIEAVVRGLDEALFLDSERYRAEVARQQRAFAAAAVRPAFHAGRSYPDDVAELRAMLDAFFAVAGGPGAPTRGARREPPRAIVAPHIDFLRGGAAYAHAYRPLFECAEPPELFVVFGTDHQGAGRRFTLTRKDYATPLGPARTDAALVDALAAALGRDGEPFADEIHHRTEHSIEFQAVWLRHALPADRELRIVPVLCGAMEEDGEDGVALVRALRAASAGRRVCVVAGADLAHVGPRFGDADALDEAARARLERADAASLGAIAAGDAAAFLRDVWDDGDSRRICGTSPIHAALALLAPDGAAGRVVAYAQCPADEEGGSLVSIASVVWD